MDKPIEAMATNSILDNSLKIFRTNTDAEIHEKNDIRILPINVDTAILSSRILNFLVFFLKLGFMDPSWRLVVKLPLKEPPIAPLMLRIPGYRIMDHKNRLLKDNWEENINPATKPPRSKSSENTDFLVASMYFIIFLCRYLTSIAP